MPLNRATTALQTATTQYKFKSRTWKRKLRTSFASLEEKFLCLFLIYAATITSKPASGSIGVLAHAVHAKAPRDKQLTKLQPLPSIYYL